MITPTGTPTDQPEHHTVPAGTSSALGPMTLDEILLVQEELLTGLFRRVETLEQRPCPCTHTTGRPGGQAEHPSGQQPGQQPGHQPAQQRGRR
jgi:hypothetical protein